MQAPITLLGYWVSREEPHWPDPASWVDPGQDEEERRLVVAHLRAGIQANAFFGWSNCRLCGCRNGSRELTDGTYIWPEGLAHYVEDHRVRLPEPFVTHVRRARPNGETGRILTLDPDASLAIVFRFGKHLIGHGADARMAMDAFDDMVNRRLGDIEIVGSSTEEWGRLVMVKGRGANIVDFEGSPSFGLVMREASAHFGSAWAQLIMSARSVDTTWWRSLSSVR